MKFLDKIKDLFTDEEEEFETKEIIVEEEKEEESKLPTFMRNKIAEEEKNNKSVENIKEKETIISDREVIKGQSDNFAFPIDIEDEYETVYNTRNKNVLVEREEKHNRQNKVADLYTKKEEPKPKKFQPTPVISPVYGVLDKNYTKDEVKVQDENSYEIQRASRKIDFETVRNKAYGTLTDELRNNLCENCELYKEVKIIKRNGKKVTDDDINLLTDITENSAPETPENISIGEAAENYYDFGVDYEPPKKTTPVFEKEEDDDIKIVNHNEEEASAEKIEVKEEIEIPEMEEEKKEPPKRRRKTTVKKEEEKDLEDTKEFEKLVEPEENIETILENTETEESIEDSIMDTDSNDIFNLIDSMYDEEEK